MVSQVEIDSSCYSRLIVICLSQQLLMIDDSANKNLADCIDFNFSSTAPPAPTILLHR